MTTPVSHGRNNRALDSPRNVRLVARLANALDYVRNLLFGRFLGHVDNHRFAPIFSYISPQKQKPRFMNRGFWLNFA
jgi:hypothetical protein